MKRQIPRIAYANERAIYSDNMILPECLLDNDGEVDFDNISVISPIPVEINGQRHIFAFPTEKYGVKIVTFEPPNEYIVKMNWVEYCEFFQAYIQK